MNSILQLILLSSLMICLPTIRADDEGTGGAGGAEDQEKTKAKGVAQIQQLFQQYSQKLTNAIQLLKQNKVEESNKELKSVKQTLKGITSVFESNPMLKGLPVGGQLKQLSSITSQFDLDSGGAEGLAEKLQSAFSIISQLKGQVSQATKAVPGVPGIPSVPLEMPVPLPIPG